MPDAPSFDYAVIRVVPHVEREEFINVGVLLFCRTRRYLDVRISFDRNRLRVFAPDLDLQELARNLSLIERIARGDRSAGPIAELSHAERWHWLTAPRSTVIQFSSAHSGLCEDPELALVHLARKMVPGFNMTGDADMTDLADRHAHPDGTAQRLPDAEVQTLLAEIPGWEVVDDRLRRDVREPDFAAALALVNRVGAIAEAENHHPDILLHGWNRVRLELYTHTAGGLTENDFIMAAKFNRALGA